MSDDKKTDAITWEVDGETLGLSVCHVVAGTYRRAAPADLAAAGYVPASQLAEATAKLEAAEHDLLDIAESARSDWTSRTEAGGKAMTRVSLLLDERAVLLDKLEAAEGRVLELEEAGKNLNVHLRQNAVIGLNTTADLLLRKMLPAPEAAKPVESQTSPLPVTQGPRRWCPKCQHLLSQHDESGCKCCECGGYIEQTEPASPPSQAAEALANCECLPGWKALNPGEHNPRCPLHPSAVEGYYGQLQPPRADKPDVLTVQARRGGFINPQNAREAHTRALKALEDRGDVALAAAWLCDAVRLLADELERAQKGEQ